MELFQYNIVLCLFWCEDADVANHAHAQYNRECVGKAGVWWRGFAMWRSQNGLNLMRYFIVSESTAEFKTHTRIS